jgi:hypothetical protein
VLSDDFTRWFDDELWRVADGSSGERFASAISPQQLMAAAPAEIWPALMPCDFLPILGNGMGDWLCIQMNNDDTVGQMIHWYHGGGDWIPWGKTLPEAIFFDQVRFRLPGNQRGHAISADAGIGDAGGRAIDLLDDWAMDRLEAKSLRPRELLAGQNLADAILKIGICEPALLCQLVIDALYNPILSDDVIRSWKIDDTDQVQRSVFDNRLMDADLIAATVTETITPDQILSQQDWSAAQSYCRRVTEIAPQLAWAWDLLGYSHERSGDLSAAEVCYRQGLNCSIFTDQTVRVRTHGFTGDGQKFSAARLIALGYESADPDEKEYFGHLSEPSAEQRRTKVRKHFSRLAEQADPAVAYELWKRAGWDLGAEPMVAFAELLERAALSAEAAGRTAQGELARTHRNCFHDRYGI